MKIEVFLDDISGCANELKKQKDKLEKVIKILRDAREKNRQVFLCGNGGSAGTATHMGGDLFKIAGIKALSLDDNVPLMTAVINDEGWSNLYKFQLERLFNKGDVLISISVHGGAGEDKAGKWSQNLNQAIDFVNDNGGITIGMAGFDGGAMKDSCDVCLVVPYESTPVVEAFHVVIHHLITFMLQQGERI